MPWIYLVKGPALPAAAAFFATIFTLGFAWYSAASTAYDNDQRSENTKRHAIIESLRSYYIRSHDGISSEMMAGLQLPPTDWLDEQLAKLAQPWRMKDYKP